MSSERLSPPAPAAAPDVAKTDEKFDEAANARLLLYEVLLDEYHNLEQPELFVLDEEGADDAEAARRYQTEFLAHSKAAPAAVLAEAEYRLLLYRALKARYDDPSGAAFSGPESERDKDFADLLGKIRQHVNQLDQSPSDKREAGSEEYEEESESEATKERLESRINEELVQEFYRLMYAAQARESPPSPPGADAGSGDEGACATAKGNGGGGNGGNGGGGNGGGGNGGGGGGGGNGGGGGGGGNGGGPAGRYEKAQTRRSALCLSGGGIRSATYNLGILQGLARHGLLGRFDYLSTVSGGGFIGGWLSAWVNRQSVGEVVDRLGKGTSSTLKPDPAPVEHLRVYSNFLSPQPGLLSADTWALVSCLVRNLLLNWFVFLPVIFALLVLPRMFVSLVYASPDFQWAGQSGTLLIAFAAGIVAFAYTGLSLPTVDSGARARRWWLPKKLTLPIKLAPLPKFWGVRPADPEYRQRQILKLWGKLRRRQRLDGWSNSLSARLRRRQRLNKWLNYLSARLGKLKAWLRKWRRKKGGQGRFLFFNLLPLAVLAGATALYCWAWTKPGAATPSLNSFILFALLIVLVPFVLSSVKVFATSPLSRGDNLKRVVGSLGGLVIAQCVMGYLLWVATGALLVGLRWEDNPNAPQLYATFAPPAILVLMSLGAVLVAGFSSRFTDDADQEWWARAGAWVLIACVVWIAGHLLVLYGPVLFLWAGALVAKLLKEPGQLSWGEIIKGALPVIGTVVSGAVTLFGGFSAETPANEKEARRAGVGSKLLNVLTGLLAPVFLAFILIIFALLTNWFFLLVDPANSPRLPDVGVPPYPDLLDVVTHTELLRHTHFGDLALFMGLMAAASVVFGRLINTNAFSLHHMWRDRIIRAYLGASRAGRRPNRFTGFDPLDNIQMHQLRDQPEGRLGTKEPFKNVLSAEHRQALAERRERNGRGKLFHVINVALNLTGGDKLAWQDRKAESLTISPLHTGSYWLGYRRTWKYGGYGQREGVSLGTAVAISGAFVSPNMGYMMTSPVVRFLMTLFNVRFGWWLGNPGRAGDGTYLLERPLTWLEGKRPAFNLRSPRLSVLPIVEEAFGHTNDRSPYVYLSDGGHFENLGLYEMVLRRCRYIVVCDASTDAEYSFDSLAMSIRQIRVDLGIPIDLPDLSISGRAKLFKNKYCAVGRIRYSCVDRDEKHGPEDAGYYDGVLIYLKPALVGSEPRDVATYGLGNESFPQEVIVDQWFSEPQFESYRELASHTVNQICQSDHPDQISFEEFRHRAEEHNQLDFRAYSDEIQYAAFEQLFKWNMGQVSPSKFKERAGKYMKDLLK